MLLAAPTIFDELGTNTEDFNPSSEELLPFDVVLPVVEAVAVS